MVLAHDALYPSLQSGVHRKYYQMQEQKVCRPQPLWKVHILEYDYPFDIRAGLLSFILLNAMVGDRTHSVRCSMRSQGESLGGRPRAAANAPILRCHRIS